MIAFVVLGVHGGEPSGAVEYGLADVRADRLATHGTECLGLLAADRSFDENSAHTSCKDRRC